MQAPSIRDVSRLDRLIGRRLAVRRAVTPRRGVTKVRQQLRASEALPFPGLYKPRPEPARWQFSDFENWTLGDPLPSQQESAAGAPSRQPGDIPLGASADGANPRTAQKAGPSGAGSIMEQRKLTFTLQRWESHQSQDRYMRHIRSFFTSSTLSSTLQKILGAV